LSYIVKCTVTDLPFSTQENSMLIKIQPDATVCRYLFTAKLLYMLRVSQHPSSAVLKTVTATSSTGHNTGTATSLQRGLTYDAWNHELKTQENCSKCPPSAWMHFLTCVTTELVTL